MIVVKCTSCLHKQFCTNDESDNMDEVACRNCKAIINNNDLFNLSIQLLEPPRVFEWWGQQDEATQQAILERAGVLRHQTRGYSDEDAWVAAMEEKIQEGDALHKFFEPKQDDDFVPVG